MSVEKFITISEEEVQAEDLNILRALSILINSIGFKLNILLFSNK